MTSVILAAQKPNVSASHELNCSLHCGMEHTEKRYSGLSALHG